MANVAVIYCKKIKDHSCVGCAKCFKGMKEKNGEYGQHDVAEIVGMTDCGDCPGLVVPRAKFLSDVTAKLDRPIEALHLGTCIKLAMNTGNCPINFEKVKPILEEKLGAKVILGTHNY